MARKSKVSPERQAVLHQIIDLHTEVLLQKTRTFIYEEKLDTAIRENAVTGEEWDYMLNKLDGRY